MYKTVDFKGEKEMCIVFSKAEDTIYVIDIDLGFETAPLYPDTPVTFNNTSSWHPYYLPYDLIEWDFGNGSISNDYNGITIYDTTGIYTVRLTMQVSKCIKERTMNIEVIEKSETHIIFNKTDNNTNLIIYPNPTNGELKIESRESRIEDIRIFDIVGKRIPFQIRESELQQGVRIDISHFPAGVYSLSIQTDKGTITREIMKK
jgi:hypothetical protein